MSGPDDQTLAGLRSQDNARWRRPERVASHWEEASAVDPRLLEFTVQGDWWQALEATGQTLLISREYEHLLFAMRVVNGRGEVSYLSLPHPSGLAVDLARGAVYVACTRNPNQIIDLTPVVPLPAHPKQPVGQRHPLVPLRARFLPGRLYLHDLAMIGGALHANAVGQNAVLRLDEDGCFERVWWPRSIETASGLAFDMNYIQLNSIAAGCDLAESFFTASAARPSRRRPGHLNFPVDRRGVVFSGSSREVYAAGLTRPHSARLHGGQIWLDNSGYGEFGVAAPDGFVAVTKLPGWTRGLCFSGESAFVGTSRVIPRFSNYAPGLDLDRSRCGVHAVDCRSGAVAGSLFWPYGNQIFGLELAPPALGGGLPFLVGQRRSIKRENDLFYSFRVERPVGSAAE